MKNVIIGILLIATVTLGALLVQKNNEVRTAEQNLAAVKLEVEQIAAERAAQEQEVVGLRERLERSITESVANASTAAKLSLALTNRAVAETKSKTDARPANPMAEMLKNPEMRDMIKQQQKTMFASMVDRTYADFMKGLNLTPEQSAALKDLIAQKMAIGTEMGLEMMSGDLTLEQRKELLERIKASSDNATEAIRSYLGDDLYASFQEYEKTIPDRMAVSMLNSQLGTDMALTDEQQNELIAELSRERNDFKFTNNFGDQNNFDPEIFSKFSEENVNRYIQEQEQLNQRYLARAQNILTPDQYSAYEKALKNQLEMAKMGMKMAASMFGQGN